MAVLPPKVDALNNYGKVQSLLDASLQSIVRNLSVSIEGVNGLPDQLKDRCLYLMSKRGLITDSNIAKVLHKNLKVLDLSECDVSDDSLHHFGKCSNIRKIDLNAAKQNRESITSEGVVHMARTCKHLQTVHLRRCVSLTDEAIVALSTNCPQLRILNIGGCCLISDQSLLALGQNSRFLKSVNFSKTQVSDNGVISLVTGTCANTLKEIHMDGCLQITDEAVEGVLQFCSQISILLFHGCPKITGVYMVDNVSIGAVFVCVDNGSDQSRQALEQFTIERAAPMKQVTWTIY